MWTSDKRLYLAPDGSVSEQPVSGGRLLVGLGGELSTEEAARYGLIPTAPKSHPAIEPPPLESKPLRGKLTKAE